MTARVRSWTGALVGAGVLTLMLSGCEAAMTDEEMFTHAREVNLAFKAAVSDVQLEIADQEWYTTSEYGDTPDSHRCPDGQYSFYMVRVVPPPEIRVDGWHLTETPTELTQRLSAWLHANDWTDITHRTYTGDIPDIVINATKPDADIASLEIDIKPRERFDSVEIRARSTCQPGDDIAIWEMQTPYPEGTELEYLPETEHPRDTPSFGYTIDGKPRFWPDEKTENE